MFKFIRLMVVFPLILSSLAAKAHGVNNGGDFIRASFFSMGRAVVQFLDESDAGIELKQRHQLDSELLLRILSIDVVSVQDGILTDNAGSVVDALGSKDRIVLSSERWAEHLASDRDVYYLVFHEMLRAIEVNDDNYLISKALQPFPISRRIVTRVASTYPIVGEVPLDQIVDTKSIAVSGEGCIDDVASAFSDIDLERNMLSIALRRFNIALIDSLSGRQACTVVVPVKAPVGKRLVISQLDFSAKIALSRQASAAISTDAVFGAIGLAPKKKAFVASEPTRGRLFLRNTSSAASKCDGSAQLLKVRIAGSAQKPASAEELNQLIGDSIAVSFLIEDCGR